MLRTVMARPVAPGLIDDKPGAFVGVYATVTRCGLIAVGDTLEVR
jgi:hypothetical protein